MDPNNQPQQAVEEQPGTIVQPGAVPDLPGQVPQEASAGQTTPSRTSPQGKPSAGKSAKSNQSSTQNTLQISEIRDGIVIMNDGSFRAVIMCKAINFDLMSGQEREAVEASYQGFLNSLYFPIQIFIRSQKVDIRPYLQKLDKIRSEQDNMLLGLLMDDYIAYLSDISAQANIMDKKFYVIIGYPDKDENTGTFDQSVGFFKGAAGLFGSGKSTKVTIDSTTLEAAKTELRNRVQAVMSGLTPCGVQALPLDTQELIELYYDAYNPDTATRQQLKDFGDLESPVVTKGTGQNTSQEEAAN